jgi:hypothetical protein
MSSSGGGWSLWPTGSWCEAATLVQSGCPQVMMERWPVLLLFPRPALACNPPVQPPRTVNPKSAGLQSGAEVSASGSDQAKLQAKHTPSMLHACAQDPLAARHKEASSTVETVLPAVVPGQGVLLASERSGSRPAARSLPGYGGTPGQRSTGSGTAGRSSMARPPATTLRPERGGGNRSRGPQRAD